MPVLNRSHKVTRRIKRTLQKQLVNHTVAERKHWSKFGQEKGNKPGPDRATTTVGESVTLKLSVGNKAYHVSFFVAMQAELQQTHEPEQSPEQQIKNSLANKKISCRLCKGDHFTSKCPYKDTLGMLDGAGTFFLSFAVWNWSISPVLLAIVPGSRFRLLTPFLRQTPRQ